MKMKNEHELIIEEMLSVTKKDMDMHRSHIAQGALNGAELLLHDTLMKQRVLTSVLSKACKTKAHHFKCTDCRALHSSLEEESPEICPRCGGHYVERVHQCLALLDTEDSVCEVCNEPEEMLVRFGLLLIGKLFEVCGDMNSPTYIKLEPFTLKCNKYNAVSTEGGFIYVPSDAVVKPKGKSKK